mmetsp:Transcript_39642/g.104638  ORF Transcript_39642/g.104638 Transcript_39642/m.104638 type:complete len:165 (-) Transcript_39642:242-736(-)
MPPFAVPQSKDSVSEYARDWEGKVTISIFQLVAFPGHPDWNTLKPTDTEVISEAQRGPMKGRDFKFVDNYKLVSVHNTPPITVLDPIQAVLVPTPDRTPEAQSLIQELHSLRSKLEELQQGVQVCTEACVRLERSFYEAVTRMPSHVGQGQGTAQPPRRAQEQG